MTLAEGTGFEPAGAYTPSVFQTDCLTSSHPSANASPDLSEPRRGFVRLAWASAELTAPKVQ